MKFHERLNFVLDEKTISVKDLYLKAEKNPQTIRNYKLGNTFPDYDFFKALRDLVPEMRTDWLLFGEGQPFIEKEPSSTGGDQDSGSHEVMHTGTVELEKAKTVNVVKEQLQQIREEFKSKMNELEQSLVAVSGKIRVAANATLLTVLQVVRNQKIYLCK